MTLLNRIQNAGFALNLCDDGFEISPASRLRQSQRDFLKKRKAEIIAELRAEPCMANEVSINDSSLSADDHQLILDYMAAIDETDQTLIDEQINICRHDTEIKRLTLERATKVLAEKCNV
jgi:hypothetical protein